MQNINMAAYNQRFQELALLCPEMVQTEARLIERYTSGLSKSIRGDVTTSRAADLYETMEIAFL